MSDLPEKPKRRKYPRQNTAQRRTAKEIAALAGSGAIPLNAIANHVGVHKSTVTRAVRAIQEGQAPAELRRIYENAQRRQQERAEKLLEKISTQLDADLDNGVRRFSGQFDSEGKPIFVVEPVQAREKVAALREVGKQALGAAAYADEIPGAQGHGNVQASPEAMAEFVAKLQEALERRSQPVTVQGERVE